MKQGILLIDKPKNKTSFYLVLLLRRITGIQKIGHAGTLDPLATGVMVMLIGKEFTRLSDQYIKHDKEYQTQLLLGQGTDSYDLDGQVIKTSDKVPTREEIESALTRFQGTLLQTPPMFSAKKVQGKRLYEMARKGEEIERAPKEVTIRTELLSYNYPTLDLKITCSSGTYVRTIAEDLGNLLGSFACIQELIRLKSGPYHLTDCISIETITPNNYTNHLLSDHSQLRGSVINSGLGHGHANGHVVDCSSAQSNTIIPARSCGQPRDRDHVQDRDRFSL